MSAPKLKPEILRAAANVAARSLTDPSVVLAEEARKLGIARSTMTELRLILEYGKAEDLAEVLAGGALRATRDRVRNTMSDEDKAKYRRRPAIGWSDNRRQIQAEESNLWGKFSPALKGLTELPTPIDMVSVVKSNRMREQTVDQYLEAAFQWMEEFKHEWIRRRAAKSRNNSSDSGTSDSVAGRQQPKPSAE